MKNNKLIIICILVISILSGCKSVDSLLKDERYYDAYTFAKTVEDKDKIVTYMFDQEKYNEAYSMSDSIEFKTIVVDYMIKKNKYEDAMHLLSDEYKNTKDKDLKENLLDLFLDRVKVEADVDHDYGSIAYQAYYKIKDSTDYEKQWTLLCMNGTNSHQKKFLDELINKKGFVNLTTYSSSSSYSQYEWIRKTLKPIIKNLLNDDFTSTSRIDEKKKQKNAVNSITDIIVKYWDSSYTEDWQRDKRGKYNQKSTPLIGIVLNNNRVYFGDVYGGGIESQYTQSIKPETIGMQFTMNLYDSDRNNIMYKSSVTPNANYWAYRSMNSNINVYFERITSDAFISELLDELKKEYQ